MLKITLKEKKNVKRVKIGPMPKVGCTSNLPYSHSWPMKSNTAPSTKLEEAIMSKTLKGVIYSQKTKLKKPICLEK